MARASDDRRSTSFQPRNAKCGQAIFDEFDSRSSSIDQVAAKVHDNRPAEGDEAISRRLGPWKAIYKNSEGIARSDQIISSASGDQKGTDMMLLEPQLPSDSGLESTRGHQNETVQSLVRVVQPRLDHLT
ncbi:UNVERIFIED_CONTAM: hypothetical protein Sradi_6554700 [Sesamum radiatum]|uniref:Uncharacterized protein n=1 Tax=Sesamum radiatum TaxID=300843 RepID=A0AAW2JWJ9_SESRA